MGKSQGNFRANSKALAEGEGAGIAKVLFNKSTEKVRMCARRERSDELTRMSTTHNSYERSEKQDLNEVSVAAISPKRVLSASSADKDEHT